MKLILLPDTNKTHIDAMCNLFFLKTLLNTIYMKRVCNIVYISVIYWCSTCSKIHNKFTPLHCKMQLPDTINFAIQTYQNTYATLRDICIGRQVLQLPIDFGTHHFELRNSLMLNAQRLTNDQEWLPRSSCILLSLYGSCFLRSLQHHTRKASTLTTKTSKLLPLTGNFAFPIQQISYIYRS